MASTPAIPAFEATPIDSIEGTCKSVRSVFRTHKTKNVEWRKVQLRKLYWAVVDHQPLLEAALMADLRKSAYEARLSEIEFVKNDILFMLKHVDRFARDEKVTAPEIPWVYRAAAFRKRKEPLGAVLIIGPFNYPLNLTLMPLVGAIAAGCTAVVKPSESAPATAAVMKRIVEAGLDREAFAVVNGAVPETTALLDQKWGKVFYTGSSAVGTLIARKAAETLTPVTLELGGRNPAFVTRNTNLKLAARRLLWGKTFNAGQTCLSHNYVLVEKEVLDGFVRELTSSLGDFFPGGARDSDMARIVNERHFLRIKKMVDETKGRIVLGGQMDQSALYIEPTVVVVDSMDDTMIAEESFGPVFALYPVDTLSEAINVANAVDPTPLALFSLGSKAENERVLNEVTSGGATLNDSFMHGSVWSVEFGGVGTSGTGSYHGKASFDTFTHSRVVCQTPAWFEPFLRVRYLPYRQQEADRAAALVMKKPDFDRAGRPVRGFSYWLGLLARLGGRGPRGALLRWGLVLSAWYLGLLGKLTDLRR